MEELPLPPNFDPRGGWIYVAMTSDDYHTFKLGLTRDNPLTRINHHRTSRPLIALQVAYFVPATVGKLSHAEWVVKQEFDHRVIRTHEGTKSEWFTGDARDAVPQVEAALADWQDKPISSMHMFGQGVICRAYEDELRTLFNGPDIPPSPIDGLPM